MKLTKLQLENFRTYKDFTYEFPEKQKITVLTGKNGKGKTNFLEAIYTLSLGRSFRSIKRDDLVSWNADFMRCKCQTTSDDEELDLEVFYAKKPTIKKNFKRNEVNLKNSEFLGNLLTVLFHPEDLNMLYLSPSFRRKYMDIILSQTDKSYLDALSKYRRVMKQRNALLYDIRDAKFKGKDINELEADLDAWDFQIVELGMDIVRKREELVEFLKKKLPKIYQSISGGKEDIEIRYKCTKPDEYEEKLKLRRGKDTREAKTSIGPHLDDLEFLIDNKKINESASRGEFRTLLLAIKLAEIDYIKHKTKRNPILLLDDVFSELDESRQKHLINAIQGCQVIITTTDIKNLQELAEEKENIGFVKMD